MAGLNPNQKRRLRSLWTQSDQSIDQIAGAVGCGVEVLMRTAAELGLPSKSRHMVNWTRDADQRAQQLLKAGKSPSQVSSILRRELAFTADAEAVRSRARSRGWPTNGAMLRAALGPQLADKPMPRLRPDKVKPTSPKVLADRGRGECAFPVGDVEPDEAHLQLYCCEPAELIEGCGPYCAGHSRYMRGK